MQFLESTSFGLRSAIWTLESRTISPTVVLLPMLHVGDKNFYGEVISRVENLDIVLTEGVKSKTSRLLTYSYRNVIKNHRLGLVLQPKLRPEQLKGKIIHADVSAKEFEHKWKKIPLFTRLKLSILFPLYGIYLRFFGTRKLLIKNQNTEISLSRSDLLNEDNDWEEAREVLLDWRDTSLIRTLGETLEANRIKNIEIGIIYGAAHMREVMKFLINHYDYHVLNSEWIDVINL